MATSLTNLPEEYWRPDYVARYLDVSRKRVYQLIRDGSLPAFRLGRRQWRVSRSGVEAFIESRRIPPEMFGPEDGFDL